MRDASYAVSQLMWTQEWNQTIWTIPNIYAIGADGKVADGCRAVESLRVIYDLDKMLDNLRSARERLQKGIVASDDIENVSKIRIQAGKPLDDWKRGWIAKYILTSALEGRNRQGSTKMYGYHGSGGGGGASPKARSQARKCPR